MESNFYNIISNFKSKKLLVIGDIMLDKYVWGKVNRISPEAPVQIVNVERESYVPGGASNVANNISSLGATAYMVSIIGNDSAKDILFNELNKRSINTSGIIVDITKPTIQKVRVIGQNQQLLRIDYENDGYINSKIEGEIIRYIGGIMVSVDAVVISDYAKGVITKELAKYVIELARNNKKIIVIDPKPIHKEYYRNVTIITPNHHEASQMTGINGENDIDIVKIGKKLLEEMNSPILITRGEKGMTLFEQNGNITNIPTMAKEVYDVTGAGDTVVATVALALCSGARIIDCAKIANHSAGIVVGKIGTSTVSVEELSRSFVDTQKKEKLKNPAL
ncbi:MAG: D-glycero-beta-D-manno-heptose-7-phosphate kinase [Nanoarchaeota archaeon]